MGSKNVRGVEIRFSSPLSSLKNIGDDRRVTRFKVEYMITFDDGTTVHIATNAPRESEVFNTPEFTRAIYDALSEFARNVDNSTWRALSAAA